MRRSIVVIVIALSTFLLLGANNKSTEKKPHRNCNGYSVIEVDKGIDCNGDTIKLIKVNGFFERASAYIKIEQF